MILKDIISAKVCLEKLARIDGIDCCYITEIFCLIKTINGFINEYELERNRLYSKYLGIKNGKYWFKKITESEFAEKLYKIYHKECIFKKAKIIFCNKLSAQDYIDLENFIEITTDEEYGREE